MCNYIKLNITDNMLYNWSDYIKIFKHMKFCNGMKIKIFHNKRPTIFEIRVDKDVYALYVDGELRSGSTSLDTLLEMEVQLFKTKLDWNKKEE